MKIKHLFSLVLFAVAAFCLQAQDAITSSGSRDVKVTTVRAGSGPDIAKGQDVQMHIVFSDQDGKVQFSSRSMGVAIHDVLGKEEAKTDLDRTMFDVLDKAQKGGVYKLTVPKTMLDEWQAKVVTGDRATFEIEVIDVTDAKPNAADLIGSTIRAAGIDAGRAVFDGLQKENTEDYKFYEWDVNRLGYDFLENKNADAAVEVFKMNTTLFPDSANTYDSLGDAYVAAGNEHEAIICFEKALELNPDFKSSQEKLDELKKD